MKKDRLKYFISYAEPHATVFSDNSITSGNSSANLFKIKVIAAYHLAAGDGALRKISPRTFIYSLCLEPRFNFRARSFALWEIHFYLS